MLSFCIVLGPTSSVLFVTIRRMLIILQTPQQEPKVRKID